MGGRRALHAFACPGAEAWLPRRELRVYTGERDQGPSSSFPGPRRLLLMPPRADLAICRNQGLTLATPNLRPNGPAP